MRLRLLRLLCGRLLRRRLPWLWLPRVWLPWLWLPMLRLVLPWLWLPWLWLPLLRLMRLPWLWLTLSAALLVRRLTFSSRGVAFRPKRLPAESTVPEERLRVAAYLAHGAARGHVVGLTFAAFAFSHLVPVVGA